ncbi:MAG TPA: glycosyltransferase [Leptolinea sp.]
MKRLLALAWCMPPIVAPRSIQVSRLLAALVALDWQSDVVTVDPASLRPSSLILDDSLNRSAGGKVKKYLVPSLEDWVLVRGLIRLFPALGVLPDPKWVWKNAAFRKCEILAESQKYSAFISFAQPWTDHIAGLQFKEQSRLPWVAHFSDPWADNPYVKASKWVHNKRYEMESAVINAADAVIFVSKQTANLVMNKYPDSWQKKVHIIPHGFEPISNPISTNSNNPDKPLELVYTGNFYGPRSPESLLKAVSMLNATPGYSKSIRIWFIGPLSQQFVHLAQELDLAEIVSFEGAATNSKSQEACQQADVLLVIDAPSDIPSVFLPSKLVDYLAFEKPILGITPQLGSSAELLNKLGCPIVDPQDVEGIMRELTRLIDARRKGNLTLPLKFLPTARQYQIQYAAALLDQVLMSITANK